MLLKLKVNIYSLIIWFQECIILKQRLSLLVSTVLFSGLLSACQFIIQRIVFDEWRPPCLSLGSRCPWRGHVVCALQNIFFSDSIGTCLILGLAAERRLQWKVTDPVIVIIWCIFICRIIANMLYLSLDFPHVHISIFSIGLKIWWTMFRYQNTRGGTAQEI